MVLTRCVGEAFRIGDDVTVKVVSITRGPGRYEVHFGIDAPRNVSVDREETRRDKDRDRETRKP